MGSTDDRLKLAVDDCIARLHGATAAKDVEQAFDLLILELENRGFRLGYLQRALYAGVEKCGEGVWEKGFDQGYDRGYEDCRNDHDYD